MTKTTKEQKSQMNKWNIELNKMLDTNIDFTKLKYNDIKELFEIFNTPGDLAIRVARYKGPKLLRGLF